MSATRYRRGRAYAADMAAYSRAMSEENTNSEEIARLKKILVRALRNDVPPRQRDVLTLYYAKGLNMRQIGTLLGVDKSTVSRTVKRGEHRLKRCLRYSGETFLRDEV